MNDVIILGTDTDVGKTTFALLWLQLFADCYEYWKPVETGESDSQRVAELCRAAIVHPPALRLTAAVAPPLAAQREGRRIPPAREIAGGSPSTKQALLIETFGSPFSPLNENELQLSVIRALDRPCVLVSSPALGCIGRTLQALASLQSEGIIVRAVGLLGPCDPFAHEQIRRFGELPVVSLIPPTEWASPALLDCAERQRGELEKIRDALRPPTLPARPIIADDRRAVWHPYTSLLDPDEPLACVGARDEFLELADGRRVIDGISSWWTILHGHRHPPLMRALAEASQKIDHVLFAGVTHPYAVELAELLLGTMPWVGGRVFYSDNGSTAVEVALKMAYQFWCHHAEPGRTRFVGFEHGYHGDTFGAMAVSRDPLFFGRFEPLLFQADILPLDPDALDKHLDQYAKLIAAVIIEPLVQGAGGMRMHSPETLQLIADITRFHGVLLIVDEVMTGGGRTGTLWAHNSYRALQDEAERHLAKRGEYVSGFTPDLLCAGKTLTGGILPLAATLVAPKVVEAFQTSDRARTFFHGHSFTANPLACAVAVCNYRSLVSQPLDAPARIEAFWRQALLPLRDHPRVNDVRIRGSIAAIEIDAPGGYLADVGQTMRRTCLSRGVLLRPLGPVLYAMPPFCTSVASLERIAESMIAAIATCEIEPRSGDSQ